MILSSALLAIAAILPPNIDVIDSRDDSKATYFIVNDTCKVKINKAELKDYDKVVTKVLDVCGPSQ